MLNVNAIVHARQEAIRREMIRRGITITMVAADGEWDTTSTVASYFPNPDGAKEPQTMSVAALYRLLDKKALPADILSMLLPEGYAIVKVPEAINHDEIGTAMADYCAAKNAAHHPDSEDGREIGPNENKVLLGKFNVLQGAAA